MCLDHPSYGYYNSDRVKLGAKGDFYTSAHVAPVFARLLARHFESLWKALGNPARFDLLELGPGDGQFAAELLPWIAHRFPELSSCLHYTAIEQSPRLRARLAKALSPFSDRARVLETLPPPSASQDRFCGIVFANEFFDALPVHLLVWRGDHWMERCVSLEGENVLWCEAPPSEPWLADQAETFFSPTLPPADRPEGWVAELSPLAGYWIRRIALSLHRGEVLIVDYGYTLEEWRAGRFLQGSALAYHRHHALEDLLANPGEQDLTAHVNFSEMTRSAKEAGLQESGPLRSQSQFLLELGEPDQFADVFAGCSSEQERLRRAQLLKTLIVPQAMGQAFRVLQLRKALQVRQHRQNG
jgi:SAM-dependent MidA family methyltransferase